MELKKIVRYSISKESIILPCRKNYKPKSWGLGGVVDSNGNFIHDSGLYMNWISFGGVYNYDASDLCYENKNVIWFGFFYKHWGHFLLDFVSRMWYLIDHYKGEDIVYVSHEHIIDSNYLEFFKLLGIDESKIRRVSHPTRFNNIIIPEYSKSESYYNEKYALLFKHISTFVLNKNNNDIKNRFSGKSFYLSRASFIDAAKKEIGESDIEYAFNASGFESISPENLSLQEQILMWNLSERIACINGTLPLNFLFGNNKLNLIVLNKTKLTHRNLDDVLQIMKPENIKFIDIFDKNFLWASKNIGDGPFVLKLTPSLREYLGIQDHTRDDFLKFLRSAIFVSTFKLKKIMISHLKKIIKKIIIFKSLLFKR
ncbi:glycosyltransferase 61 family protein [Klebsiella variicola]|uniref:glycosyltransferase 61 family protein n=1 Tax=Klebsiella TaxID=570 RepID=UPI00238148E8|nr:glycosyltransferase 61 family protein [Klebsiella variicola]MDE4640963.1 glycosyltransferase 61 family protein [Klebsiella variicola]